MSLKILYSDRIEDLAADLKEKLLAEKVAGSDPFRFTQVVVPNTNIAKWLQMRVFAADQGLCAGISFPFMEQRFTDLLRGNLAEPERFELLPDHAYAHAIMRILLTDGSEALKCFRAYIDGGEGAFPLRVESQKRAQMAWQLADKLASMMDTYEVRRPEIVTNWLAGGSAKDPQNPPRPGSVEAGEAALTIGLWGRAGAFPPDGVRLSLRQMFERVRSEEPKGPRRTIYFFGQSTLTLLQVQILSWLAKTHDVILYHNNPCREYWGDIETAAERRKALFKTDSETMDEDPDKSFDWTVGDATVENPLLTKFGIAGRETLRLLVDLEEEVGEACSFSWSHIPHREKGGVAKGANPNPTVLSRVQDAIRQRTSDVKMLPQDASIQVVGTPGIRREVEMVYNSILGSVYRPSGVGGERPWKDCSFSDIAVLVPDMKTYRPVIESVFDARGEVPYGLIDTSASENSQYLAGFLALMELKRKGLSRETLFAVLENPCVQTALDFTRSDVMEWRELTNAIGAFDGFERKGEDDCFCWDWALSRQRLGRVANTLPVSADDESELPLVARGEQSGLRLSEIVELLYRELQAEIVDGLGLLHLANEFLAVPEDDQLEESVRREIARTLNGLTYLESYQTFELPVAAVEHFVGGIACRKGGYLTHGVTIAGLQPMRPVPFRQVYVLGLGAGGFPGRTSSTTLDVRGAGWRLGDVSQPNMNRYLFLETLMAVRDRLVLSYPNRDIEKDAELFPSSVVLELESFLGKFVACDEGRKKVGFLEFKGYPLLEHGESWMDADALRKSSVCPIAWDAADKFAGLLPTYSAEARKLARRRNGNPDDDPRLRREWEERPVKVSEYTAKELAEFLRSPMRAVLRYRFGVSVEGFQDRELDSDSPLGIQNDPALWELQFAWLDGDSEDGLDRAFRSLQLSGGAPMGFLGDFAKARLEEDLNANGPALKAFVSTFGDGVQGGQVQTKTGRAKIRFDDGSKAGERFYSVELPGWTEDESGASVLVCGYLGDEKRISEFPSDRALEPLMTFVIDMAGRTGQEPRTLRVGVVDLGHGTCRAWRWADVTPVAAREYLKGLTADYEGYLKSGENGRPVVLEYRKLTDANGVRHLKDFLTATDELAQETSLKEVLRDVLHEDFRAKGKDKSFNGNLVIQKVVAGLVSEPDADTLKSWIDGRYSLPLQGKVEGDAQ